MNRLPTKQIADATTRLLKAQGVQSIFDQACLDWPSIGPITSRLVAFLSPVLVHENSNVAGELLARALNAYCEARRLSLSLAFRAFINELGEVATLLSVLRISVQDEGGLWLIWEYDEPLTERLAQANTQVIRIRDREVALPVMPIKIKVLAQTVKTKDMVAHGVSFTPVVEGVLQS